MFAAFVGDPREGALNVTSGRAVLDRVNRDYGLSLQYTNGPYAIILPQHPQEPALPTEQVVVIQFAGRSSDEMVATFEELSRGALRARLARSRWSWPAFWAGVQAGFTHGEVIVSAPPPPPPPPSQTQQ
jgi:hypothetical protein